MNRPPDTTGSHLLHLRNLCDVGATAWVGHIADGAGGEAQGPTRGAEMGAPTALSAGVTYTTHLSSSA